MNSIRRMLARCTFAAVATVGLLATPGAGAADAYPSNPVVLMVPYPAGGLSDAIARSMNTRLSKALGQPVLVENLGGVSGAMAAQKVLNAPADGYMIFLGSPNEVILSPLSNAAVKLRTEDFRLLTPVTVNRLVMVARPDLPVRSVDDLIALAKANPAKPLTYGSVGPGSMYHLVTEDMATRTHIGVSHIPYKGMAPLMQDLAGKNVDFAILPYAASFRGLSDQGRLKLVGWAGNSRSKVDPAIPAFGEGTQLKDFDQATWAGIMVKQGTPEAVVARLHQALVETLQDAQVVSGLEATGAEVAKPSSVADAQRFLQAETGKFRAMAKRIHLQPQ